MVLGGEEELEYEVACVDGMQLEHVSEFKYIRCVCPECTKKGSCVE